MHRGKENGYNTENEMNDGCFMSQRLSYMQEKIKDVEKLGEKVGLKINATKSKIMIPISAK
jgi:hypothetical protein